MTKKKVSNIKHGNPWGGKRKGAGRKLIGSSPMVRIWARISQEQKDYIDSFVGATFSERLRRIIDMDIKNAS